MKTIADNQEPWRRPMIFVLLEEGAELAATFCVLIATALYAASKRHVLSLAFRKSTTVILAAGLLLGLGGAMLGVELLLAVESEGDTGKPRNWFGCIPPALTAVLAVHLWLTQRRPVFAILALLSAVTAAFVGSDLYSYFFHVAGESKWSTARIVASIFVVLSSAGIFAGVAVRATSRAEQAAIAVACLLFNAAILIVTLPYVSVKLYFTPVITIIAFTILLPILVFQCGRDSELKISNPPSTL